MSITTASAAVVMVAGLAVTAASSEEAAATFSVDVNVFTAGETVIMITIRADLPADWTVSSVAWSAEWIAEQTVLLVSWWTGVDGTTTASAI